jgi:DNA gyrase subunit A
MATLHPAGDLSIYDATVRMSQNFSNNIPLINGHGNWSSITGDPAAASRYTECRLEKFVEENILRDIDKNAVDFVPNFDNTSVEPKFLPAKIPLLLVNGATGIGAGGISTFIPPHNLIEVCQLVIDIIKKDLSIEEVAKRLKPDFPTGGILCSNIDVEKAYLTGRGNVLVRAKIEVDKKNNLLIKEIPYGMTMDTLIKSIIAQVKVPSNSKEKSVLDEVKDVRDESSKTELCIKIVLKKDSNPELVINKLYKYTRCEETQIIVLIATTDTGFDQFNIKSLFSKWIEFRKETLRRIFSFNIKSYRNRIHIIDGLIIALKHIDEIIEIIKKSKSDEEVISEFATRFKLSELQTKHILNIKLSQLKKFEWLKLKEEKDELLKKIDEILKYLFDGNLIYDYIVAELKEIIKNNSKKYPRKTQCLEIKSTSERKDKSKEKITEGLDTAEDKEFIIGISDKDLITKIDPVVFKAQRKAGSGRNIHKSKRIDSFKTVINCNNKDYLMVFTTHGRLYYIKVWNIKEGKKNTFSINSYISLKDDEKVSSILPLSYKSISERKGYLLFFTDKGKVKRTKLNMYLQLNRTSIIALKLHKEHKLIKVLFIKEKKAELVCVTKNGFGIRTRVSGIPLANTRATYGCNLVKFKSMKDVVQDVVVYTSNDGIKEEKSLVIMTDKAIGKVQNLDGLRITKRYVFGKKLIRLKAKDKILGIDITTKKNDILIFTKTKSIRVSLKDFRVIKHTRTSGHRFIKLKDDDSVLNFEII